MKTYPKKLAKMIACQSGPKERRRWAVQVGALAQYLNVARKAIGLDVPTFDWKIWDAMCDANTEPKEKE